MRTGRDERDRDSSVKGRKAEGEGKAKPKGALKSQDPETEPVFYARSPLGDTVSAHTLLTRRHASLASRSRLPALAACSVTPWVRARRLVGAPPSSALRLRTPCSDLDRVGERLTAFHAHVLPKISCNAIKPY